MSTIFDYPTTLNSWLTLQVVNEKISNYIAFYRLFTESP